MARTSTTGDCVWGSVTDERDKAFMATTQQDSPRDCTTRGAGVNSKAEKRTPPPGRTASDRSLGWMTKSEGMVNINLMSDNHLLNSIALLRRNIMMTKLQTGQTSLSLLSLRYMEDEANDRGLNHENNS